MKIGRNDNCPCKSGKKYKKCCGKITENPLMVWQNNFDSLHIHMENSEELKTVLFSMLNIIKIENWQGACHAVSSVLYVVLNELNLEPKLFIGEVQIGPSAFDHSWIEIDNKIYDVTLCNGLEGVYLSDPVIANVNIETLKHSELSYGVKSAVGFDPIAQTISKINIVEYMDGYPEYKNGLWHIVDNLGKQLNKDFDIPMLKEKYKNTKWNIK